MPGFQIGEVFTESLRFLFKQLRAAFVLAAVPYALLLVATILALSIAPEQESEFVPRPGVAYEMDGMVLIDPETGASLDFGALLTFQLFMMLLALIIPLPFKVAWLRYTLLGPQHQPVRLSYGFGNREMRFLAYTLGLIVVMSAIGIGGGLLAGLIGAGTGSVQFSVVLSIAASVLLVWISARLYFVFPAVALDLPGGFGRSWTESRGQAFKLIVLTLMLLVVLGLPALVISSLLGVTPIVATVITTVLQIIVDAGMWTALGLAYWRTTGIPGNQATSTPPGS